MQLYNTLDGLTLSGGSAVAMGYFDGIHLGHCNVLGSAVDCACQQLYAVVTDRYAASTAEMTACLRGVLKVGVRVIYGTL